MRLLQSPFFIPHAGLLALLGTALALPGLCAQTAPQVLPVELRCEHRDNPLGIRETRPRLTWRLEAASPGQRGLTQTAWQILVASSPAKLAAGEGDIWDSSRVESAAVRAVFAGKNLEPSQQVWWKLRVWDGANSASPWSEPATWSRGLPDIPQRQVVPQWPGTWIGLDEPGDAPGPRLTDAQRLRARAGKLKWIKARMSAIKPRPRPAFDEKVAAPPTDAEMPARQPLTAHFKKNFPVEKLSAVESALIWIVPDMVCEIHVNNRHAETVARWELARQIDIAPFLKDGENTILLRITQEDGYAPAALGEIEITLANQKSPTLVPLDDTWQFAESDTANPPADPWKKVHTSAASPWGTAENTTHRYSPAPYMRKEFSITKPLRRATLYATAAGIYEIELNGRRVGEGHFAPGWTEYTRRLHVQSHDVTTMLSGGKNAIGLILGDGWFAGVMGYSGYRHAYGGHPRARAMLLLEHDDGSIARIVSDDSWKAAFGPIRHADFQMGCAYDARLEMPGWSLPGFDDSLWHKVDTGLKSTQPASPPPLGQTILKGATLDSVRITGELPAQSVREISPGVWIVDFGQNLVGWVRMKTRGPAGQRIMLRHGEILNPNGTLYTSNLRAASSTDEFWLKGSGDDNGKETLEPKFTFHGFRYAEVRGLSHPPRAEDFTGIVVHTPMKRTGWFESSDPLLNRLFENIVWGQRGNYLEIPTDCPQRDERLGWSGDTQFFARTASFNYDTRAFLERWLESHLQDSQTADGALAAFTPIMPGRPGLASTAWGDAGILVTHTLWQHYAETRPIERHFDAMSRYIDWLERRSRADGTVYVGGYGDWLNKGGTAKTEVIDTAYYAHLCDLMAQMAKAIGRNADAARFARLHNEVRAAFEHAFLREDGSILESSQTGYALAFTMDLVPARLRAAMTEKFNDTMKQFDWHLATGFIGTPRLMPALFAAGLDDTAWRVLMQDTYPSWLYQVKLGATTMWERWDGWTPAHGFQAITMNSFNHYAFGAVGESLYRNVAGIDTDGPGFRNIIIRPRTGGGLSHARAACEAITGRIESSWKLEHGGRFTLDVKIPVGSRARIHIPAKSAAAVTESGLSLSAPPGLRVLPSQTSGEIICETGSGDYYFAVTP